MADQPVKKDAEKVGAVPKKSTPGTSVAKPQKVGAMPKESTPGTSVAKPKSAAEEFKVYCFSWVVSIQFDILCLLDIMYN